MPDPPAASFIRTIPPPSTKYVHNILNFDTSHCTLTFETRLMVLAMARGYVSLLVLMKFVHYFVPGYSEVWLTNLLGAFSLACIETVQAVRRRVHAGDPWHLS